MMILFFAFLFTKCANKMKGDLSMFIKVNKTSYNLGEPILVEISYENSSAENIIIENPSKSINVEMHVLDLMTREDMSYFMGKLETTVIDKASDQYATALPPIEEIEIKSGSSFLFTTDPNDNLYLRRGEFLCFMTDHDKKSNEIYLSIQYTKKSIAYLLKLARDNNMSYGRREWAMEWLQPLYPNFKLKLSLEEDSDDIKVQNETHNKSIYEEFLNWWDDKKDSVNIEEVLKQSMQDMF